MHDLVIHPRDGDLIAATHGRSLWILDDITPLQQLTPAVLASDAHAFSNRVATIWKAISRGATRGHLLFQGRNPLTIAQRPPANSPSELQNSATVSFYVGKAPAGPGADRDHRGRRRADVHGRRAGDAGHQSLLLAAALLGWRWRSRRRRWPRRRRPRWWPRR